MYDTNLSDYLEVNIDLLKDMEKNIKIIISRFDIYNKNLEARKNMIFYKDAYQIIEKYNVTTSLEEYLRYIDKQEIKGLPRLKYNNNDDLVEEFDNYSEINVNNLTCYKILKELINLAKEVYLGKEFIIDEKEIVINNKAKILDFDLSKRNNHKKLIMKPKDECDN